MWQEQHCACKREQQQQFKEDYRYDLEVIFLRERCKSWYGKDLHHPVAAAIEITPSSLPEPQPRERCMKDALMGVFNIIREKYTRSNSQNLSIKSILFY
jgi:hypothetical protein